MSGASPLSLSRDAVAGAIAIISSDSNAKQRIESIVAPILGTQSGFFRNLGMALGFGAAAVFQTVRTSPFRAYAAATGGTFQNPTVPLDPNRPGTYGYELQCTAIVEAAVEAIQKRRQEVAGLQEATLMARSEGFAHAGVHFAMTDKTNYVIDWWATLDVMNPLLYRADDFDKNRKDKAVLFQDFRGFA
jgi:hypothetical protein